MSDFVSCELAGRAVLRINGDDRADFLQNIITNDINGARNDQMIYALLLTPQGKFLFDFFIHEDSEGFLVETQKSQLDQLIKTLTFYRLRAKVAFSREEKLKIWFIWTPHGEKKDFFGKHIFRDPRASHLGWRMISAKPPENIPATSIKNYTSHRIALGVPEAGYELTSERFPLECNLDTLNAIDFNKGCYIGQEVTSRLHRRVEGGRRRMAIVDNVPESKPGTAILTGDQKVGELLSAQGTMGLAIIRRDRLKTAQPFIDGQPIKLTFMV